MADCRLFRAKENIFGSDIAKDISAQVKYLIIKLSRKKILEYIWRFFDT